MLSSSNSATQPKEIEMVLNLRREKVIRASSRRMLNQDTPAPCGVGASRTTTVTPIPPSSSMIKKKKTKKTRRKVRSKTRKPKYLSLRLQLFSTDQKPQDQSTEMPTHDDHLQPQRNFFPLHPETCLVQDKDVHDDNMAYLFSSSDGGATTLTGLLGAATTSSTSSDEDTKKNHSISTTLSQSASLTYAYGRQDREEEVALLRTAIRNKERERSEERWVRYSEVVERRDDQEVSSCCAFADLQSSWRIQGLSLKLDYKEILNAWSDKGPLYIHDAAADSPQTVPDDIHHEFLTSQLYSGSSDGWGSHGGCVWRVPEMMTSKASEQGFRYIEVKTEEQQEQVVADEELKVVKREASVQRYKEKRQNRLFSKRIRYQVRKLNAEKRPRLKGRFVKRS